MCLSTIGLTFGNIALIGNTCGLAFPVSIVTPLALQTPGTFSFLANTSLCINIILFRVYLCDSSSALENCICANGVPSNRASTSTSDNRSTCSAVILGMWTRSLSSSSNGYSLLNTEDPFVLSLFSISPTTLIRSPFHFDNNFNTSHFLQHFSFCCASCASVSLGTSCFSEGTRALLTSGQPPITVHGHTTSAPMDLTSGETFPTTPATPGLGYLPITPIIGDAPNGNLPGSVLGGFLRAPNSRGAVLCSASCCAVQRRRSSWYVVFCSAVLCSAVQTSSGLTGAADSPPIMSRVSPSFSLSEVPNPPACAHTQLCSRQYSSYFLSTSTCCIVSRSRANKSKADLSASIKEQTGSPFLTLTV